MQPHSPGNLELAIQALSPEALDDVLSQLKELERNKIALYTPYTKQRAFHDAGAIYRERLLRAGNQNGKTLCGGCEGAFHLTGDYPHWWAGRRFDRPIVMWACGVTGETTRDNPQRVLLGQLGEQGTGTVPASSIVDTAPARGVADLLDYAKIRHKSGGLSTLRFKYYEQGRQKWQGPPVDVVWLDEEPPQDIYDEGLARTIATGGIVYLTFTPLLGMSEVVRRFLTAQSPDRHDTNMTIDDALHIPEEERARIIASFPEHEREARAKGAPVLGRGRIFPIAESEISVPPFKMPVYWPRLGGMDFGYDHPFAAVEIVYDLDGDVVYIVKEFRSRQTTPIMHVATLREWGKWLPWAWPHDGLQHDKGSGEQLAKQYADHGLEMMSQRATFPDGSNGVEAGISIMRERMETGRLKVFSHLSEWFEEFRLYHRKALPDGGVKIEKTGEDLMSATRYGIMMLRHAMLTPQLRSENRKKLEAQHRNALGADPLANF